MYRCCVQSGHSERCIICISVVSRIKQKGDNSNSRTTNPYLPHTYVHVHLKILFSLMGQQKEKVVM